MGGHAELPLRQRLDQWVEHLAHVLPAQAPIGDFVHHNTLHGFQHLPFPEALAAAHRLTGARPYLPEARCHELHRAGRITDDDLAAALDDAGIADLDAAVVPGRSRRTVLVAALLELAAPPPPARQQWELREMAVGEAALWQTAAALTDGPVEAPAPADWAAAARAEWQALTATIGRDRTWRAVLADLTGEDILERVRTVLQRHLAAHLDLGVAAWRNPGRGEGFYAAWRASAGCDFGWELDELPALREELAWLPASAIDLVAQELARLLPDEALWYGYLERLALELPGWSGMMLWRDRHPRQGDGTPVAMVDYLAVRLLLERLLSEDLLRRLTGGPLEPSELAAYFAARPAELYVRRLFFRQALPEDLAHRAAALVGGDGRPDEAAWAALAEALAARPAQTGDAQSRAWQLFRLATRLGMAAGELAGLGPAGATALLQAAAAPDALERGYLWLLAYERHYRQEIFAALAANRGRGGGPSAPSGQAVFCMDDREEGTRRHLEEIAPAVETFGAAGFFGVAMAWRGLDDEKPSDLCPVVVRPAHRVDEAPQPGAAALAEIHRRRRNRRLVWRQRFVQETRRGSLAAPLLTAVAAPVAVLSLAAGSLAPGWFGEALAAWRERFDRRVPTRLDFVAPDDGGPATPDAPRAGFTDAEQAERVGNFLRAIGLTARFAPVVALIGHGSASRNNPHRSAYDCGACSGRHGGPNARLFAAMANRPAVRRRLAEGGIDIPAATWFVGAEHNTCDDGIEWYDTDLVPAGRQGDFDRLAGQLAAACKAHAAERCRRFASAPAAATAGQGWRHVQGRRHDLGEARPELGHATNAAAFIGRRSMSRGLFLDRRVFLISYDPLQDAAGTIVEAILLAAGPVGAGISLEYYFSTVDNDSFGCGSKITHNLTGQFGVMEGADSDLRTGLPLQMVEIHEAMRLLVVVEQTPEVLSAVVARQPALAELVGGGWIVVAAQHPGDGSLHRFCPRRGWLPWSGPAALPRVARSADWFSGRREPLPPALLGEAP